METIENGQRTFERKLGYLLEIGINSDGLGDMSQMIVC